MSEHSSPPSHRVGSADRRGALLFSLCCSVIALLALPEAPPSPRVARAPATAAPGPDIGRGALPLSPAPALRPADDPAEGLADAGLDGERDQLGDSPTIPGELMLRFAEGVDVDAFAAEHGLEVRGRPRRGGPYLLGRAGADARDLQAALIADPRVLGAAENGRTFGAGTAHVGLQHHLPLIRAWGELPGNRDVGVAVLDSGVAIRSSGCNPAQAVGGIRGWSAWDYIGDDGCAADGNQHGTHIASTIASYDNEVLGVSPGATIISYRVLGTNNRGNEWALVSALLDAADDSNVDVVNLSLTFAPGYVPSEDLKWALDEVVGRDKPVIAAAGNDGLKEVGWPAAHPGVIAVGSVCAKAGGSWEVAPYSNTGPQIDLMAPGGCLDRDTNGDGVVDGILAASIGVKDPSSQGWWLMAGTSQAAAVVTGAVVTMLSQGLDPRSVRYALQAGAKQWYANTWRDGRGAGRLDLTSASNAAWGAPGSGHDYEAELHVGLLPQLEDLGTGSVRPRAELSVQDEDGAPVAGVQVTGGFTGTTNSTFVCTTDSAGRCAATGNSTRWSSTGALSWRVQAGQVINPAGFAVPARATIFVDDDLQAAFAGLSSAGQADALLGFEWADETTGGVRTKASFTVTNSGTGISTSPFGLIMTPPALDQVARLGASSTMNIRLSKVDGSGISTSPFGYRVITLDRGGSIVALDGSGISTSPFGARSVLLPDTADCGACVARRALMTDLATAEIGGASATVRGWGVAQKLSAGGWVTPTGSSSADAVAASQSVQPTEHAGSALSPVQLRR